MSFRYKSSSSIFKNILSITLCVFLANLVSILAYANEQDMLEKSKKAMVIVENDISFCAYEDKFFGKRVELGFVTDIKEGLIVVAKTAIGEAGCMGTYSATFYNKPNVPANLIYYDEWKNYAILKVEKINMPENIEEIKLIASTPRKKQKIFVVGNDMTRNMNFYKGDIHDQATLNNLSQDALLINSDCKEPASGSPILNEEGEAIGFIFGASGDNIGAGSLGNYPLYAVKNIIEGKEPVRKHAGFIVSYDYGKNPLNQSEQGTLEINNKDYAKELETFKKKTIVIDSFIAGSPAIGLLKAGDTILGVEGKDTATLDLIEDAMNQAKGFKATFTIYRDGQRMEIKVPLYDINANKIKRIVRFEGVTFFESNDTFSYATGIPMKSLVMAKIDKCIDFHTLATGKVSADVPQENQNIVYFRALMQSINEFSLTGLDSLINAIPKTVKSKKIKLKFKNYYNSNASTSNIGAAEEEVELRKVDVAPVLLELDPKGLKWISTEIK